MLKKTLFVILLIFACKVYSQSTISGSYFIGDKKVSIGADEMSYWLMYDGGETNLIQYEENTPANEQIWTVKRNGKRQGTIVFNSDYSSGIYTDYESGKESYVKKIP